MIGGTRRRRCTRAALSCPPIPYQAPQEIQESETQTVINEQLAMTEDFKEAGEALEEVKEAREDLVKMVSSS